MLRQGEDPVKVASMYIELPENEKEKKKQRKEPQNDYPLYRLGRNMKKAINKPFPLSVMEREKLQPIFREKHISYSTYNI